MTTQSKKATVFARNFEMLSQQQGCEIEKTKDMVLSYKSKKQELEDFVSLNSDLKELKRKSGTIDKYKELFSEKFDEVNECLFDVAWNCKNQMMYINEVIKTGLSMDMFDLNELVNIIVLYESELIKLQDEYIELGKLMVTELELPKEEADAIIEHVISEQQFTNMNLFVSKG